MPHATAAAEPADDPPGVCFGFHGLRVFDGTMNANSVLTVLPSANAPERSRCSTSDAEPGGR